MDTDFTEALVDEAVVDEHDPAVANGDNVVGEPLHLDVGYEVVVSGELGQFDRPPGEGDVVGDPWTCTEVWEMQQRGDSCAVVAQGYVLELVSGQDVDEDELVALAEEEGWYVDGGAGGTAMSDVGKILEHFGLQTDQHVSATMSDLEAALADGQYVIAGVDSGTIWQDTSESWWHTFLVSQSADHAVQVIGVDRTDAANPMVVLNDPGHPQGQGLLVPVDQFAKAWEDAGGFMVTTEGE
jgi:hypothetical protein